MPSDHARATAAPRLRPPWWTLAGFVLITVASVLVILGGYEVFERLWLRDLAMGRLHMLHRLRGLVAALVAAVLMTVLILRRSPPLFTGEGVDHPGRGGCPREADKVERYARWFIAMRWVAVVAAAVLVFFTVQVVELLPRDAGTPLLATVGILALTNAAYAILLRSGRWTRHLLRTQAYGDLLVLTVLLHYSGGMENPLATLMLFHVVIVGIILTRRECYLVAGVGSALFAALVWAEWSHTIGHYTLQVFPHLMEGSHLTHAAHEGSFALSGVAVQTTILFLTAYFTTTMAERIRKNESQLALFADRLLTQSQLLERALDTTGTGLCVCDSGLNSTWCNGRWQSWFGHEEGGCAGVSAPDGSLPARRTLEDGAVRTREVTLAGPQGSCGETAVLLLTTAPILDKDGSPTHVVQLGREVTEEKRLQAGMLRAEKLAAVGELAGKVAHEVNNPIAVISAKARLLLADADERPSPRAAEELAKIAELADRVARIAQGLLSYCRPAPGLAASIDLGVPLHKALAIVEAPAALAGVRIEVHLPEALPPVRANAGELEQVFLNLFLNALDAMPEGGTLALRGAVQGELAEPSLQVIVEDTGVGIPEHLLASVFEPFVTTKAEGRGTGLGLSICLGLVRSNGGEIELDSAPGRGTRVRLRFPAHLPTPTPEVTVHA